jgi:uncharacterized membrane protein
MAADQIILIVIIALCIASGLTAAFPLETYQKGWRIQAIISFLTAGILLAVLILTFTN